METVITSVVRKLRLHELEILLLRWGKIVLKNVIWNTQKSTVLEKLVSQCNYHKISYHDAAELDLLLHIIFPEKRKWQAFKLDQVDTDFNQSYDAIQFRKSLQQACLCYGYYDVTIKQDWKGHFWIRISKPGSVSAAYIIHLPNSRNFLFGGSSALKPLACETLTKCLRAHSCKIVPLYGKHLDSLVQRIGRVEDSIKKSKHASLGKKRWSEEQQMSPQKNGQKAMKFTPERDCPEPCHQQVTLETHAPITMKSMSLPVQKVILHGRLEFEGSDVLSSLNTLHQRNLAEAPLPSFITRRCNAGHEIH